MSESIIGVVLEQIAAGPVPADVCYLTVCAHTGGNATIGVCVGSADGSLSASASDQQWSPDHAGFRETFDAAVEAARAERARKLTQADIAAREFGPILPIVR